MFDWWGDKRQHVAAQPFLPQAMILRNLSPLFALVTGLLILSCAPYPEDQPQPKPPADPAQNKTVTSEDQQKLQEERKRAAEEAEKKMTEQEQRAEQGGTAAGDPAATGGSGGGTKPAGERKDWPFASPVPGKTGFVFSPYNNKVIDVRDIPSGMLVQDPTYPASEKKYFRVP